MLCVFMMGSECVPADGAVDPSGTKRSEDQQKLLDKITRLAERAKEGNYQSYELTELFNYTQAHASHGNLDPNDAEAWAVIDVALDDARAFHKDNAHGLAYLYSEQARLYAKAKREGAADLLLEALAAKPSFDLLDQLGGENNEQYAGAVGPVCNTLRPKVFEQDDREHVYFVQACVELVDGDMSQLWDGAAEEFAAIESDEARLEAFHVPFATYFPGGGLCPYGKCKTEGWNEAWGPDVRSKCTSELHCYEAGWVTDAPEGIVTTECGKGGCNVGGWKSKGKSGTWTAKCNDGNCATNGWTLSKGKEKYVVTCRERTNDCSRDGFYVVAPDGAQFSCKCHLGNCWWTGTKCQVFWPMKPQAEPEAATEAATEAE
ncbi:hypothetical protein DB30_04426 [Enhygromyxa salina]|uniref:Uncharacterized protein n=1 Tax=Enhygromyxa salina TaxID=215803 RepID=A0A0C1ZZ57_9BACT|nr:hypothetical protein DB30_04426 [Enhygromyxa salina]